MEIRGNEVRHEDLKFPCLAVGERGVFTLSQKEIVSTALALRNGKYSGLRLIDSSGIEAKVVAASKIRGIGPLRGWNLFLNQRIYVSLDVEATGKTCTADELRQFVLAEFRSWGGWKSREDFDGLKAAVLNATSCSEILRLLTSH